MFIFDRQCNLYILWNIFIKYKKGECREKYHDKKKWANLKIWYTHTHTQTFFAYYSIYKVWEEINFHYVRYIRFFLHSFLFIFTLSHAASRRSHYRQHVTPNRAYCFMCWGKAKHTSTGEVYRTREQSNKLACGNSRADSRGKAPSRRETRITRVRAIDECCLRIHRKGTWNGNTRQREARINTTVNSEVLCPVRSCAARCES